MLFLLSSSSVFSYLTVLSTTFSFPVFARSLASVDRGQHARFHLTELRRSSAYDQRVIDKARSMRGSVQKRVEKYTAQISL